MAFTANSFIISFTVGLLYLLQLQALPIPSTEVSSATPISDLALLNTTAIDTLSEPESTRVKRQGGCGCGCGCCCCRPRCCCTCCRTCCCTRCCTCCRPCCCCCRPCCCCGGGGGGGCGCGCGGGCCGCCGCGGGGRKRRSLQYLKIKLADKTEREARAALPALPATAEQEEQQEQVAATQQPPKITEPDSAVHPEEPSVDRSKDLTEFPFSKPDENAATEWPQPVFELVTEKYA